MYDYFSNNKQLKILRMLTFHHCFPSISPRKLSEDILFAVLPNLIKCLGTFKNNDSGLLKYIYCRWSHQITPADWCIVWSYSPIISNTVQPTIWYSHCRVFHFHWSFNGMSQPASIVVSLMLKLCGIVSSLSKLCQRRANGFMFTVGERYPSSFVEIRGWCKAQ